jgi:hypothetical protein
VSGGVARDPEDIGRSIESGTDAVEPSVRRDDRIPLVAVVVGLESDMADDDAGRSAVGETPEIDNGEQLKLGGVDGR